jgi:hypothetical protein
MHAKDGQLIDLSGKEGKNKIKNLRSQNQICCKVHKGPTLKVSYSTIIPQLCANLESIASYGATVLKDVNKEAYGNN